MIVNTLIWVQLNLGPLQEQRALLAGEPSLCFYSDPLNENITGSKLLSPLPHQLYHASSHGEFYDKMGPPHPNSPLCPERGLEGESPILKSTASEFSESSWASYSLPLKLSLSQRAEPQPWQ